VLVYQVVMVTGRMHLSSHSWCWSSICHGFGSCWSRPSTSVAVWRASIRRTVSAQCWQSTDRVIISPSTMQLASVQHLIADFMESTLSILPPTTPGSATDTTNQPEASSSDLRNQTPMMKVPVLMQPSYSSQTYSADLECGWTSYAREHWSGLKWLNGLLWRLKFSVV